MPELLPLKVYLFILILFPSTVYELQFLFYLSFPSEIETDNLTVSNSEIITLQTHLFD